MNRKLRQLGVVLVLWVLVVTLLAWAVSFLAGTASAFSLLKLLLSISKGTLLQSGLLSHCWFLWALAFLYILLPLLSRLTLRGKCTLFGILVCLGVGIQVVSCLVGQPVECHVPQAFRIWIWLEYFLLGGLVYPICKKGLKVGSTGVLLAATSIVAIAWAVVRRVGPDARGDGCGPC